MVAGLYRRTMEEGFGGLTELRYSNVGWGDAEWAELSAALRELPCAGVVTLDLSYNKELRSGEALAGIGELTGLQKLKLVQCMGLTSLPDTIGQLSALKELDLSFCKGLTSLPDLSGLPGLEVKLLPSHLQPWEAGGRKAWKMSE